VRGGGGGVRGGSEIGFGEGEGIKRLPVAVVSGDADGCGGGVYSIYLQAMPSRVQPAQRSWSSKGVRSDAGGRRILSTAPITGGGDGGKAK